MTITVNGPDGSTFNFPDGTPEDTISGALHTHYGTTPPAPPVSTSEDIKKTIAPALQEGVAAIGGAPGDLQSLLARYNPFDWAARKFKERFPEQAAANEALAGKVGPRLGDVTPVMSLPTTKDIEGKLGQKTGIDPYEPKTLGGQITGSILKMAPAAATGPLTAPAGLLGGLRGVPGDIARYAAAPALTSEAAGQIAKKAAPDYEGPIRAAVGIATGALAPRAISPLVSRGETVAEHTAQDRFVRQLEQEGVRLSPGQRASNENFQYFEQNVRPELTRRTHQDFTEAATRIAGNATPLVVHGEGGTVDQLRNQVGPRFDRLQAANTLHVDAPLTRDLGRTLNDVSRTPGLYNQQTVDTVNGIFNRIVQIFNSPTVSTMSGHEYQTLTSDLRRVARGTEDPQRAYFLNRMVDQLDRAMERSIARTNPTDAGAFREARNDYKKYLVLDRAASAAGAGSARGYISPAQLESAAKAIYGKNQYERGLTPFSRLGNAGAAVIKTLPTSGTSERTWVNNLFGGLGHVIAGGGGALAGRHAGGSHDFDILGFLAGEGFRPLVERGLRSGAATATLNPLSQILLGSRAAAGAPHLRETLPGLLTTQEQLRQMQDRP
jgi:hypothetical protein